MYKWEGDTALGLDNPSITWIGMPYIIENLIRTDVCSFSAS